MRDRFNSRVYDASFQIWRDYIEALETLGVDINSKNLLFPKDLIAITSVGALRSSPDVPEDTQGREFYV